MLPDYPDAYPRPQLRRRHWTSLDGTWRFRYEDAARLRRPGDIHEWPQSIRVPFPPESKASGIGDRGFHSVCWYQRDFELRPDDGRVLLHFGAVDYEARVWVNDAVVATHEGGHTPFSADITSALRDSGAQSVTVRVQDDPHDLTKPRGKQDWQLEPHSMWYPRTYVDKIRWTPHVAGFALTFEARIVGERLPDPAIELELTLGNRLLARDRYEVIDNEADRRIVLSDPGIDDFRNELRSYLWGEIQASRSAYYGRCSA